MAVDLDQIQSAPLSSAGSYGEGQVYDVLDRLQKLKTALTSGQITSSQYMNIADPLVQKAHQAENTIAGQGSKAASAVNPAWNQIVGGNFIKQDQGQWVTALPLSEQEFASLPDASKPTADQINQGLVPATALPGNVALNTQIGQQQQQQTNLFNQALQQAQQRQQDTQNQLQGMYGNFMTDTTNRYNQAYQDIANNLQNQQNQQMQNLTTGPQGEQFRQYYNNLGLLNSGAFNTGLGNAFGQIQQNTQNQLLQSQLDKYNALQNAAQQGQNALTNYGVGGEQQLQDIANQGLGVYSGLGTAGLGRQFSLEDFFNQANLQKQLADMQNNAYLNAIQQGQVNPWTQAGIGFIGGVGQGVGKAIGSHLF